MTKYRCDCAERAGIWPLWVEMVDKSVIATAAGVLATI